MSKFHINPDTGEANICRAGTTAKSRGCKFATNGVEPEHYATKLDAEIAYAKSQENPLANPLNSATEWESAQKETLDPELEDYIEDGPFGRLLNHPLVQDFMVDSSPGMANWRLKDKKRRLEEAETKKNWNHYVFLHERPYRFQAMQELLYSKEINKPNKLVRSVWIDSENIYQNYDEWRDVLSEYGISMSESEKKDYDSLPDIVKIYRGCTPEGNEGYSWTTDKEQAVWFKNRFRNAKAHVITGEIPKNKILAYLTSRSEKEIVIFPEDIRRTD